MARSTIARPTIFKPTIGDIVDLFPHSTVHKDKGFSVPLLAGRGETLLFRVPDKLPKGPSETTLLPGRFRASRDTAVRELFRTDFAVQIATGWLKNGVFRFGDPASARHLAVIVRWEKDPPEWVDDEPGEDFARQYMARWMERISPQERIYMSQILGEIPHEAEPLAGDKTGYDCWVLERTDFYQEVRKQRASELIHTVYHECALQIADEIKNDPLLPGWSLECGECEAALIMVGDSGETVKIPVSYEQIYLYGLDKRIRQGRAQTRAKQRREFEARAMAEIDSA